MRCVAWFAVLSVVAGAAFGSLSASAQESRDDKKAFKRRDQSSDEDLRKKLLLVPEVGLDQSGAAVLHATVTKLTKVEGATILPDVGKRFYAQKAQQFKRPDWLALPWRTGPDAQLGKETAEKLHVFSRNLRACMSMAVRPGEASPAPEMLRKLMSKGKKSLDKGFGNAANLLEWNKAEAVPTLAQMLQAESKDNRLLMIEILAGIDGKDSSVALARRAVYDLAPEVREQAVKALAKRPAKDYQPVLIEALRWPWQPAADHAAEALAALQLKGAATELIALLKEPDPKLPFVQDKVTYVRELVRINHLSNCFLCHPASLAKNDLVRGSVPAPGQELSPVFYAAQDGLFVRADTTFLRQDFSLMQPVTNPGKWPGFQRYDYLLRTRKATIQEAKLLQGLQKNNKLTDPYAQRDAVLFALREITHSDKGSTYESWLPLLNPLEKKKGSR